MVDIADVAQNLCVPWLLSCEKFTLSDVRCDPSYKRALLGHPRGAGEEGAQSYGPFRAVGIHKLEIVSW